MTAQKPKTTSATPKGTIMNSTDVKVGDKVYFGRGHGEKTLGEITKKNGKTAKVKQLESRGTQKSYPIGTTWTVPYSLMSLATVDTIIDDAIEIIKKKNADADEPVEFDQFDGVEQNIMLAIFGVYMALSPENLTCDGELSRSGVNHRHSKLTKQLRGLEQAMGRKVSESAAWDWYEKHQAWKAKHKVGV
jgi:hypothetical protein